VFLEEAVIPAQVAQATQMHLCPPSLRLLLPTPCVNPAKWERSTKSHRRHAAFRRLRLSRSPVRPVAALAVLGRRCKLCEPLSEASPAVWWTGQDVVERMLGPVGAFVRTQAPRLRRCAGVWMQCHPRAQRGPVSISQIGRILLAERQAAVGVACMARGSGEVALAIRPCAHIMLMPKKVQAPGVGGISLMIRGAGIWPWLPHVRPRFAHDQVIQTRPPVMAHSIRMP